MNPVAQIHLACSAKGCTASPSCPEGVCTRAARPLVSPAASAAMEPRCQCGVRAAKDCAGAWEQGCDLGANPEYVRAVDPSEELEEIQAEESGFVHMPRTAEEARSMVAVGNLWLMANAPKPIGSLDKFLAYAEANGIKTIHDLPGLILSLQATEPVEVHQWRARGTSPWCDGVPDRTDGGGPYETRTLFAGAAPEKAAT